MFAEVGVDMHNTAVFRSVEVKVPAIVVAELACRAVNWKPHTRAVGSEIVTTRCCFVPGEYVRPNGNATSTFPPPAFTAGGPT
jgi:hypothetical protein